MARIGAGGMGEVYRARDPRLGRDVAVKVVAAGAHASGPLDAWLLNEARQASALRPSRVPEANEEFQRAMLISMTSLDLPRVRAAYQRALDADPSFAEARAEYGFALALEVMAGFSDDSAWFFKAEEEIRRALRDDPANGRAHSALAGIYLAQGRKELVPSEVERALAANANDLAAWGWWVWYHESLGQYGRARELAEQALALNPLFFPVRMGLSDALLESGDTAAGLREAAKLYEQAPDNPVVVYSVRHVMLVAGDVGRARAILTALPDRLRRNYLVRLHEALLLAVEGRRESALAVLDADALKYAETTLRGVVRVPEIYAMAGRPQDALDWLDRSVRLGDERAEWLARNPLLASLRAEPVSRSCWSRSGIAVPSGRAGGRNPADWGRGCRRECSSEMGDGR